ncbi:UNVERIFIED_CONTAM: hypothetical protein FKN15_068084 [Acipenser sinensis]
MANGRNTSSLVRYGTVVSVLVVLLALWYRSPVQNSLDQRLDTVLTSLLRAESKVDTDSFRRPKVAIGFGGCVDIIVDGVKLLNEIGLKPSKAPFHHDCIESREQLSQSFAYFFPPGAASERFLSNDTLFNELVEASRGLHGNRWALGGNAAVMANRLASEGCDVLLGGRFSPEVTEVLSDHVTGNEDPDLVSMLNIPSACTTSLVPPTTNPPAATPVKRAKSHKAKSPRAKSPRAKSPRLKSPQGRGTTSSPPTTAETPRNEEPKVEIEPSLSEVNAEPVPELPDFQSLNVSCPNGLLVNFFSEQSLDVRDLVGGLPKSPAGTWVATAPSGLRVATKGEEKIQIKHVLAYKATDPVNEVAMITREDKVLTAIGNDDYVAVEHADGTRITTFNQDVEIPGSMDHDETELDPMSSRLEGMHSEGGDVNPYHSLKVDAAGQSRKEICRTKRYSHRY